MQQFPVIKGELPIAPSPTSSKNDFDFYAGKWNIRNRKLKTRLNHCTEWIEFEAGQEMFKVLNGLGNVDFFKTGTGDDLFEGMTLRLFNPQTRLWSIYWADSNKAVLDTPVTGSFENGIGRFYAEDIFDGKNIWVMFLWDASNPDEPVWSQAFSEDKGKSWEWNWYMYMTRVK
ncbi:MAG: hypothetical protein Q8941_10670 [Bacteroidota bacterium]|nr:hypothetical protein [Bacteroidota bacterium]